MISSVLIKFERSSDAVGEADFGEKAGNIGLGLLRIGFGKTVTVKKISNENKVYSLGLRVAAVILATIILPITVLMAGVGCIGTLYSKSHKDLLDRYLNNFNSKNNYDTYISILPKNKPVKTKKSNLFKKK